MKTCKKGEFLENGSKQVDFYKNLIKIGGAFLKNKKKSKRFINDCLSPFFLLKIRVYFKFGQNRSTGIDFRAGYGPTDLQHFYENLFFVFRVLLQYGYFHLKQKLFNDYYSFSLLYMRK